MTPLKKGDRIKVFLPETEDRGQSLFHRRKGIITYRNRDNSSRYFVHLQGDAIGIDTEFMRSELEVRK